MTMNQREFRSPHSRVKQVLMRLQHEAGAGSRAITAFATICDMVSIPYRAGTASAAWAMPQAASR